MLRLKFENVVRLIGKRRVKVCYALATDGERRYVDLVSISALAVKRFHPSVDITVLTDDQSLPIVRACLGSIGLGEAVRGVGEYFDTQGARSRFVKTQVRQFMDGDFIYLDADAIPVAAFSGIFRSTADISAAIDRSPQNPHGSGFPHFAKRGFDLLGWQYPRSIYLNSGVIYWRDTPKCREFGHAWHRNWKLFYDGSKDFADQPAFNYTLLEREIEYRIMDERYNSRVGLSQNFATKAKIYHFYASDQSVPGFWAANNLLFTYRSGISINTRLINRSLKQTHSNWHSNREYGRNP